MGTPPQKCPREEEGDAFPSFSAGEIRRTPLPRALRRPECLEERMINIFVTYRCNLACSSCFARDMQTAYPEDLSQENFRRLLEWMRNAPPTAAGFIGGEPTLHPRLGGMLEDVVGTGLPAVLFTNGLFREVMAHVVGFVKACEARGVRTGLDCSVRLCDLRDEDRRYLERASMKFSGVCHPSIDVHPDLGASYCLPMRDVRAPDITAFPGQEALMWHFAQLARPFRQADITAACFECKDFMRRRQGGCMALGRTAATGCAPSPDKVPAPMETEKE